MKHNHTMCMTIAEAKPELEKHGITVSSKGRRTGGYRVWRDPRRAIYVDSQASDTIENWLKMFDDRPTDTLLKGAQKGDLRESAANKPIGCLTSSIQWDGSAVRGLTGTSAN